jgi:hypothetical protein
VAEIRYYNFFLSVGQGMFPGRRVALLLERTRNAQVGAFVRRNLVVAATKG